MKEISLYAMDEISMPYIYSVSTVMMFGVDHVLLSCTFPVNSNCQQATGYSPLTKLQALLTEKSANPLRYKTKGKRKLNANEMFSLCLILSLI